MSQIHGNGIPHPGIAPAQVVRFRSNDGETVTVPLASLAASQDIPDFNHQRDKEGPNEAVSLIQDAGKKKLLGLGLAAAGYGALVLAGLAGGGALATAGLVAAGALGLAGAGFGLWGGINGIRALFAKNE